MRQGSRHPVLVAALVGVALTGWNVLVDALFDDLTSATFADALGSGGVVGIVMLLVMPLTDGPTGGRVLARSLGLVAVAVPGWILGVAAVVPGGGGAGGQLGWAAASTVFVAVLATLTWWWTRRQASRPRPGRDWRGQPTGGVG